MSAFHDAIALDQIHALERNVQASIVGVPQQHELAATAIGFDLAKSLELADAVIDVHDEVAGFEFREVAEEAGSANFLAGALDGGSAFKEIGVAQQGDLGVGKCNTFGEWRTDEQ